MLGFDPETPITGEQRRNLLAVRLPDDPDRELRRVGGNGRAVAAIDVTFSAPKSVSIVWAFGSTDIRRAIEAAHERAVDRALAHAVEHVQMVRRRVERETVRAERVLSDLAGAAGASDHQTVLIYADFMPDDRREAELVARAFASG